MPAVQVREMPQDLYEKVAEEARLERRSLAQQMTVIVEEHFAEGRVLRERNRHIETPELESLGIRIEGNREERRARRRLVLERIRSRVCFELPDGFPNAAELVREDRDTR
ncbi:MULTISPECIES: hypothetical protein [Olsenella]|uniref:hypothetical protein n=1 Tax=Olsenella TaxID=133925 RepID=UPI000783A491|nr:MULTISPECIES: hypothetical protein [Olsenella]